LEYTPAADGNGSIAVTLDGESTSLPLPREHQAMGAHFNRFGLISTHTDGNGQHIYFDDLTYTWTQRAKNSTTSSHGDHGEKSYQRN
jgi:hypothetical protein